MEIKLVLSVLFAGFILAGTGQLTKATHYMLKLAVDAQRHDMVFLGDWNRAVMDQYHHHKTAR